MADMEKVIKGLDCCAKWMDEDDFDACNSCPYHPHFSFDDHGCLTELNYDAIALLKKQEAVEPHYTTLRYIVNGMDVAVQHPECPRCIENGLLLWDAEIERGQSYCKRCGQAVKWND